MNVLLSYLVERDVEGCEMAKSNTYKIIAGIVSLAIIIIIITIIAIVATSGNNVVTKIFHVFMLVVFCLILKM